MLKGAKTNLYDPASKGDALDLGVVKSSFNEAVEGVDCIVILTGEEQFKHLNLRKLKAMTKTPSVIVDLAGAFERKGSGSRRLHIPWIRKRNRIKMKKIGVAVIGTGFWGKNHARIYKELPSTELIAICDVNPERAKAIADQFGVKAYTNSSRMLKNKEIEAISICTWSTVLAKEALKGLRAGKHVLVEKPMATNSKQAEKLCATAEQNGLVLTVGFLMRFIPGLQVIREAVEKKKNRRSSLRKREACFAVA